MMNPLFPGNYRQPAPCRGARWLLIIIVSAGVLVMLAATADLLWRASRQDEAAAAWMKPLALSAPALQLAGDPLRHPELQHPGVDLRFAPNMAAVP
jgi:hypothetical protein